MPGKWHTSSQEALIAIREDHDYKTGVVKRYPKLVAAAAGLREAQVAYYDLRMLFAEVPEPPYIDDCCHLNERGNDILGRRIAIDILSAAECDTVLLIRSEVGSESASQQFCRRVMGQLARKAYDLRNA